MGGDLCININQALGALAAICGWALFCLAIAFVLAWGLAGLPEQIKARQKRKRDIADLDYSALWGDPTVPEGLRAAQGGSSRTALDSNVVRTRHGRGL